MLARSPIDVRALYADPERAIRGQISDLIAKHDNPDSRMEDEAVNAAREGRAAFWCRTRYHNALVGLVATDANRMSLADAIKLWCCSQKGHRARDVFPHLIPLNVRAVEEIDGAKATAYWQDS
jgi:hypothetical protein